MTAYLTPGVYIEEIPTLPPSVAEVATAVPAFLGYTEQGEQVARVTTMFEYEQRYGGARPTKFQVQVAIDQGTRAVTVASATPVGGSSQPEFLLPYAVRHHFANGGGPCYIVPVGNYGEKKAADFKEALDRLRTEDEPTLVVLVDAVSLPAADYYDLSAQALALCADMKDRFALLDVPDGDVQGFRDGIGTDNLMYGAAYHPYLVTTLPHVISEDLVTVQGVPSQATTAAKTTAAKAAAKSDNPPEGTTLAELRTTQTAVHAVVLAALAGHRVVLPPSPAMAGICARVDRERGVWKAPANVGVAGVLGPVTPMTDDDQALLNVDQTGGKSLNAIRAFTGRGTLVWGARTLAGNDNEWRYVPVRRLFITIEESIQKATSFAVFEPNDATTWLKLRGMVESYLHGLWQSGALAGSTQEQAYFVHAGLGQTMTAQDVLEGRLIITVGVAAVRPAEFIVLQFSHLLQQA
jgi:phage tail sheath protein FI